MRKEVVATVRASRGSFSPFNDKRLTTLSQTDEITPAPAPAPAPDDPRAANNPLFGHKQKKKPRPAPPYDGTQGEIEVLHVDMVKDDFWQARPWLLK